MTTPKQVGAKLLEVDGPLNRFLGFELIDISTGHAVVRMVVQPHMLNGAGVCQGGLIFALADHAFAYACMSTNQAGVTLSANIIFNRPGQPGDRLIATATVTDESRRTASCGVVVINQHGETVAQVSGVHYRTKGSIVEERG